MTGLRPHYLLFSESSNDTAALGSESNGPLGRWRIVLEAVDGSLKLDAADDEDLPAERLALLAVIRGLEAIPQPARVTLVTSSDYVRRGLRFGLDAWRENDWQWEQYGERSNVSHADLWQRLDRALQIHRVQCRNLKMEGASGGAAGEAPAPASARRSDSKGNGAARSAAERFKAWLLPARGRRASLCAS